MEIFIWLGVFLFISVQHFQTTIVSTLRSHWFRHAF